MEIPAKLPAGEGGREGEEGPSTSREHLEEEESIGSHKDSDKKFEIPIASRMESRNESGDNLSARAKRKVTPRASRLKVVEARDKHTQEQDEEKARISPKGGISDMLGISNSPLRISRCAVPIDQSMAPLPKKSPRTPKHSITKENVQNLISSDEMYKVIIDLVDTLHSTIDSREEDGALQTVPEGDTSQGKFIKKGQGAELVSEERVLTFEHLAMVLKSSVVSQETLSLIEMVDKYRVLKGPPASSITRNLERWAVEAHRVGLGWVLIDDVTLGFRVDSIQAWLVGLIFIHESQSKVKFCDVVDFKLGIDACTRANKQGTVCEVMLELLCNPSPLSCVSVAKWEGEDQHWDQMFWQVANNSDPKNLLRQLHAVCEDGLDLGNRHLNVTFVECHHMAFYCSVVCGGKVSALGDQFCPWCTVRRQARCVVTTDHLVAPTDTINSLCLSYHMRPQILVVCIPSKSTCPSQPTARQIHIFLAIPTGE